MDLVMCRATTGKSIGKTCDYCTDRCILCECPVNLVKTVRLCDECSFDFLKDRCVICNSEAKNEAKYCRNCVLLEKD